MVYLLEDQHKRKAEKDSDVEVADFEATKSFSKRASWNTVSCDLISSISTFDNIPVSGLESQSYAYYIAIATSFSIQTIFGSDTRPYPSNQVDRKVQLLSAKPQLQPHRSYPRIHRCAGLQSPSYHHIPQRIEKPSKLRDGALMT